MAFDVNNPRILQASFVGGVILHIFAFRKGEWDLLVPHLTFAYAALFFGLSGWILHVQGTNTLENLAATFFSVILIGLFHVTGILTSMVLYRVFFHRLRKFPGPFLGRISNLYPTYLRAKKLHLYEEVEILHQQYGDFVRLGPTELSIIDPSAVEAIYSARSRCTKGPFYNVTHPRTPLNMIRDRNEHHARRKIWDRGFNAQALRDYEPRVTKYTDELLARLAESQGTVINAADWFNFYSFDVMGDLAFGKSFNMLQDGVKHYFMTALHASMTLNGYLSHIAWIYPFVKLIPIINSENSKFWAWCGNQVEERSKNKPDKPDVFSWILDEYEKNPKTKQAKLNLDGEAYLIAVAGSDTTAVTLTNFFFELATHKSQIRTLQLEIDEYFSQRDKVDAHSLSKLSHLNALIDETLRLHPPVPSGLQRVTPPEGLMIGKTRVPGNTIVQVPLHTLQRDERFFEKPLEFIPERWTTMPELTKNSSIYAPFSIGRYSCVGKQLGLMEIRYVVSQIIHRFDVQLAQGQTTEAFLQSKRDTFTLAIPRLDLIFTPRT
ncbi:cytochrome P450 [Ilyonectria sp. MPI-CAGE-AT-0026]|nr:cytochrome P450 [Ilyonectria sp. MPI-CAGE-AT-0026]